MADTSLVFNILAKDKATRTFDRLKGVITGALTTGAVAAFGKQAVDAAANLQAAMGSTRQIFKDSSQQVLDWSKTTADALGISRTDALSAAKDFGSFFTEIGMGRRAAADLSTSWVEMSANLAAFRDVDPTQALEALQSALRGELDPLQQFIPSISAASIEQKAMEMTGKKNAAALTQQEKALAINAIAMQSNANVAGEAEQKANGFGVQQAKLKARIADVTAEIGQKLLPVAAKLTEWALAAMNWMKQHSGLLKTLAMVLGPIVGIIAAIVAVTRVWTIVQTALNVVMALNPIGLVVLAIVALIAIFVVAYKRSETFRKIVTGAWNGIKAAALTVGRWFTGTLWPWIKGVWNKISSGASTMFRGVKSALTKTKQTAISVKDGIVNAFNRVIGFFRNMPGRIRSATRNMFSGIKNAFRSAVNWIIGRWNNLSFRLGGRRVNLPFGQSFTIPSVTLHTPNIPYLAKGGTVDRRGFAVVGERGPEVVQLARGAQVTPLDRQGGPAHVVIDIRGGDQEMRRLIRKWIRTDNLLQGA